MTPKFKHFSVISVSSLWVLFLLYILYIDGTFINGKPLIAERLSIATILGPFVLIYLIFNHHNKPKDKKQLSALAFGFWGVGGALVAISINVFFNMVYEDFFILVVAFCVGIINLTLGYWTYENSDWNGRNSTVKSRQSNVDYEVINFSQVGEVVSKWKTDGNWNVLTSDEYRTEVIEAAGQAISEYALKSVIKNLLVHRIMLKVNKNAIRDQLIKTIDELDEYSVNQIYPLISSKKEYLDYFYNGDQEFRELVTNTILDIDKGLTPQKLEKAYKTTNPCSEYWPVISSKIDAYSK